MFKKGKIKTNNAGYAFIEFETIQYALDLAQSRKCLHADEVMFSLNAQGTVDFLKVVSRQPNIYVGKVDYKGGNWVLLPDQPCFCTIFLKGLTYLVPGVIVAARIDSSQLIGPAYAKLERVLGAKEDAAFIAEYALAKYDLESVFDYKPIQWLKKNALPDPNTSTSHIDLTSQYFITVDGEDTKDLDDAIHIQKSGDGFLLNVAIADVSYYVKDSTDIDKCAYDRGTSVYFADRVTPMLPPELSNGLLSLVENTTRLAVICEMQISKEGKVLSYKFYRGKIENKHRLSYSQVYSIINGNHENIPANTVSVLDTLLELYNIISKSNKSVQELDDDNNILVKKEEGAYVLVEDQRNTAHFLVETAMLLANECAANKVSLIKKPFLRAQSPLTAEALEELSQWLELEAPSDFSALWSILNESPNKKGAAIKLKSLMAPAEYTSEVKSHYSLDKEYYTHFTSPIRRYADLTVHRILLGEKITKPLKQIAEKCTEQSKKAKFAEKLFSETVKKKLIAKNFEAQMQVITTIIGQTEKSIRLKLNSYGLMVFINNKSLEEAGYTFDKSKNKWTGLELGSEFKLEYAGYFEDNFGYQLKFKISGFSQ